MPKSLSNKIYQKIFVTALSYKLAKNAVKGFLKKFNKYIYLNITYTHFGEYYAYNNLNVNCVMAPDGN